MLALVYTEKERQEFRSRLNKRRAEHGLDESYGYDEIRVAGATSWQTRATYVGASDVLLLDKGVSVTGTGAVLSSTAHQVIGWGTPIVARDNNFFAPFKMEIAKYKDADQLKAQVKRLLTDEEAREKLLVDARRFAIRHSPERIATRLLDVFAALLNHKKDVKIAVMSSWNTDGGVSRHATPLVEWFGSHKYPVKVFTHYKNSPHGMPLEIPDEEFVHRIYSLQQGTDRKKHLDPESLLKAVSAEGYNVFLAEDLGTLPMEELLAVFPTMQETATTVLVNHDNEAKPPDSAFWKFDWDAIINFLPEQIAFMRQHYQRRKLFLIPFLAYPVLQTDREDARKRLGLPAADKIILTFGEYDFLAPLDALCELRNELS